MEFELTDLSRGIPTGDIVYCLHWRFSYTGLLMFRHITSEIVLLEGGDMELATKMTDEVDEVLYLNLKAILCR